MPGGGGPESINSQEILKNTKNILDELQDPILKESVVKQLEQESGSIDNATEEAFGKKIQAIRNARSYSDIATSENALLLKTFAVLHYGVKADAVGGINGNFGREALAILRKCQTDGIGGKSTRITEGQVDKVSWDNKINKKVESPLAQTQEVKLAEPTKPVSVSSEEIPSETNVSSSLPDNSPPIPDISSTPVMRGIPSIPRPPANTDTPIITTDIIKENMDGIKDGLIKSLKDIKVAGRGIPSFLKDGINPDIIKMEKTSTTGVYEVLLPKGNEQATIEGKVYIDKDGKLVNEKGEANKESNLHLRLPGAVSGLYIPFVGESKGVQELTKSGKMTPDQARELIGFIKGANLQGGENKLALSQNNTGISVRKI